METAMQKLADSWFQDEIKTALSGVEMNGLSLNQMRAIKELLQLN
jgi:hypothetical protein